MYKIQDTEQKPLVRQQSVALAVADQQERAFGYGHGLALGETVRHGISAIAHTTYPYTFAGI